MVKDTSTTIIPISERTIDFYGDKITAALILIDGRGHICTPIRPICEYIGLDWSAQWRRINRHPVLSLEVKQIRITKTHQRADRDMFSLPLEFLSGWLFSIKAGRVKFEHQRRLTLYKGECWDALSKPFQDSTIPIENLCFPSTLDVFLDLNFAPLTFEQIKEAVRAQCRRAAHLGLPATLTPGQWLYTLKSFCGNCAYCQSKPAVVIDHFIPLSLGKGTTIGNCVPSCFSCNSKKSDKHPCEVTTIPQEIFNSIRSKLEYLHERFSIL